MSIWGNVVGNVSTRANWNQEDPTKSDYIIGKETVMGAIQEAANGAEPKKMVFHDVSVYAATFAKDSGIENYPFVSHVQLDGVTENMIPEVYFGIEDASKGIFAPYAQTYHGGVYIYASAIPEATTVVPTIICWRGDV